MSTTLPRVLTSGGGALNPYTTHFNDGLRGLGCDVRRASARRLISSDFDVWHINWPEAAYHHSSWAITVLRAAKLLLLVCLCRCRRKHVVWTVHNLRPHRSSYPTLDRWFFNAFSRLLHGSLHLSHGGRAMALEEFPALGRRPSRVGMHGTYDDIAAAMPERREARKALGIPLESDVLAFVGSIAPYKGVEQLVLAFKQLSDPMHRLLIAGASMDANLTHRLERLVNMDQRVWLDLGAQPEVRLAQLLAAADVIVLPYGDFLNSGVLLLGLTATRVVLTRATPVTTEIRDRVGSGWVQLFSDELRPTDLTAALSAARRSLQGTDAGPDLAGFTWTDLAMTSARLYADVALTTPTSRAKR